MKNLSYTNSQLAGMSEKEVLQYLASYVPDVETVSVRDGTREGDIELTYNGKPFKPLSWNSSAQELLLQEELDSICTGSFSEPLRGASTSVVCEDGTMSVLYSHDWPNDELGYRMSIVEAVLIKYGLLECAAKEME